MKSLHWAWKLSGILGSIFLISHAHAEFNLSASFQLPQGFELAYRVPAAPSETSDPSPWSWEVALGGLPLERAWPQSLKTSSGLDATYALETSPRVFILNSSFRLVYQRPLDSTWKWKFGLGFLRIHGDILAFLKNQETGESVLVAEIQGRYFQPYFHASGSWIFSRNESRQWELNFGLAFMGLGNFQTQIEGPVPALQRVAPEYAQAIDDGTHAAETNLSNAIHDALRALPLLPSIGIGYTW